MSVINAAQIMNKRNYKGETLLKRTVTPICVAINRNGFFYLYKSKYILIGFSPELLLSWPLYAVINNSDVTIVAIRKPVQALLTRNLRPDISLNPNYPYRAENLTIGS